MALSFNVKLVFSAFRVCSSKNGKFFLSQRITCLLLFNQIRSENGCWDLYEIISAVEVRFFLY